MRIRVDHHRDSRGALVPQRLHFDGRQIDILETIDQWHGPDYRYLKVRGDDGDLYILRFDESRGEWALTMYQRSQDQAPRSAS
jgi:hypothetical protein